jgi:hypothetical protein
VYFVDGPYAGRELMIPHDELVTPDYIRIGWLVYERTGQVENEGHCYARVRHERAARRALRWYIAHKLPDPRPELARSRATPFQYAVRPRGRNERCPCGQGEPHKVKHHA